MTEYFTKPPSVFGHHEISVEMLAETTEHMAKLLEQHKNQPMDDTAFIMEMILTAFKYLPTRSQTIEEQSVMIQKQIMELANRSNMINGLEETITNLKKDLVEADDRIDDLEGHIADQQYENTEALKNLKTVKANFDDLIHHLNTSKVQVVKLNNENVALHDKAHDLADKLADAQYDHKTAVEEIKFLQALVSDMRKQRTNLNNRVYELETLVDQQDATHKTEVAMLKLAGADMTRQRDELRAELARVADDLSDTDATLAKVGALIDHILKVQDAPDDGSTPGNPSP